MCAEQEKKSRNKLHCHFQWGMGAIGRGGGAIFLIRGLK